MLTPNQLTLAVKPSDDSCFENFFVSQQNQQLVNRLNSICHAQELVYLWGPPQAGKTHLLQSVAANSAESFYLSFQDRETIHSQLLEGLHELPVVCLDDIQLIAGDSDWESAIFDLYNRIKEAGSSLIIASNVAPSILPIELRDLQSRLQSMLVYHLASLNDDEKKSALQLRASQRGFELNDAVASYIMTRAGRSFDDLMKVLDALDNKTLETQRRLSIPLVRETLEW
ncbi:MAG: DnaA family protein [Pseudohongiellaceae bacterium]|jgi:DnaA family protein